MALLPKQLFPGATLSPSDSTMHWAAEISAGQLVSRSAATAASAIQRKAAS
jgi:hypothetical protein